MKTLKILGCSMKYVNYLDGIEYCECVGNVFVMVKVDIINEWLNGLDMW